MPYPLRSCSDAQGLHPGLSCSRFWLVSMAPLVVKAFKVYAPVHFIPLLLFRFRKMLADPVAFVTQGLKATAWSTLFLTMYGNVVKGVLCSTRAVRRYVAACVHPLSHSLTLSHTLYHTHKLSHCHSPTLTLLTHLTASQSC
jgi:hypothetical protein